MRRREFGIRCDLTWEPQESRYHNNSWISGGVQAADARRRRLDVVDLRAPTAAPIDVARSARASDAR